MDLWLIRGGSGPCSQYSDQTRTEHNMRSWMVDELEEKSNGRSDVGSKAVRCSGPGA